MKKAPITDAPENGRFMGLVGQLVETADTWQTLPSDTQPAQVKPVCEVGGHRGKWSNAELIAIGDRVQVQFNGLGQGVVVGYFTDHGGPLKPGDLPFIGLEVKPDAQPAWHVAQNGKGWHYHVFGAEVKRLQTVYKIRLRRKSETGEWLVKVWINGAYSESATYYTDCKADAVSTMALMVSDRTKLGAAVI